jgi:hypothetical protein
VQLRWPFLCVIFLLVQPCIAAVSIHTIEATLVDESYVLDVDIEYDLADEVRDALQNGIELHFEVQAAVVRSRNWMWDETVDSVTRQYSISYRPLAKHYQVGHDKSEEKTYHKTLSQALRAMGAIRGWPLINSSELIHKELYQVRVKCTLEVDQLPLPLQPTAYFSQDWQLDADPLLWRLIY